MKLHIKSSFFSIFLFLMTGVLYAQDLPKLGVAPEISVGKLPNGLTYYLVSNKNACGLTDYALVQKAFSDVDGSRAALDSLDRFQGQKPYKFLASRGAGYGSKGYLSIEDGSTIYRFSNVPTSDAASSDTTLMMLFEFSKLCPTEQAVIISGDIDVSAIKGKMSIFSLMVTKRDALPAQPEYVWDPKDDVRVITTSNHSADVCSITAEFATPRTTKANLNTVQSHVSYMLFSELGIILERRVKDAFREAEIPLGSVTTRRRSAADGLGDEAYSVSIDVPTGFCTDAVKTLSNVFANIDKAGISEKECSDVHAQFMTAITKDAPVISLSNAEYIDRCASAYLYGTDLAAMTAAQKFLSSKALPSSQQAELLNTFASAMFDDNENLTLSIDTPAKEMSGEEALAAWEWAWTGSQERRPYRIHQGDTLSFNIPSDKTKLKLNAAEPVSGGSMWTFANGMKVVYKKMATPGQFSFAFLLRGGYASIPDLENGEGAFASDVLDFYDVCGMSCRDFGKMLDANGISLDKQITISDLRVTGTAPSSKLSLLLKSMYAFSKDRSFNADEYGYYTRCEALRLEKDMMHGRGLIASIDSIIRPGFAFTPFKEASNLRPGLPAKVETYLTRQFAKMDDGIIVMAGDLEAGELQKIFSKYLGALTTSKQLSPRPQAQYDLSSGWTTYSRQAYHAQDASVNVAMSALIPVTAERYFAFKLAQMVMERRLSTALSGCGYRAEITDGCELFPKERLSLLVSCHPVAEEGLPASVTPAEPYEALVQIRRAVDEAVSGSVGAAELKMLKGLLLQRTKAEMARPSGIISAVMTRYSDGKDLSSKYAEVISALPAGTVEDVLAGLGNGGKVEYIITK